MSAINCRTNNKVELAWYFFVRINKIAVIAGVIITNLLSLVGASWSIASMPVYIVIMLTGEFVVYGHCVF